MRETKLGEFPLSLEDYMSSIFRKNRVFEMVFPSEVRDFSNKLSEIRQDSRKQLILVDNYELIGKQGEYVSSKIFGMSYDDKLHFGDQGIDGYLFEKSVQVKTTNYSLSSDGEQPHLIFFIEDRKPKLCADIYILIHITDNVVTLVGWADKQLILTKGKVGDWFPPDYNNNTFRWILPCKLLRNTLWESSRL